MKRTPTTVAVSAWGKCLTEFSGYPGWRFPAALEAEGFIIVPLRDRTAEHFIALEHSAKNLKRYGGHLPSSRRVLIALEPDAVAPAQHSERVRRNYGLTLVQSPFQLGKQSSLVVRMGYLPSPAVLQDLRARAKSVAIGNTHAIGIINENKFSFVRGNQYSTRRRLVRELASSGRRVDLAGRNWDASLKWRLDRQARALAQCVLAMKLPDIRQFTYRGLKTNENLRLFGRVESEIEFLASHVFSLVVENDPHYISEKLFNAVIAGSVPIYIGPDLHTFGIPSSIAVALDPKSSGKSLNELLTSLANDDILDIKRAGELWLNSQDTQTSWNHDASFDHLAKAIRDYLAK